MFDPAHSSNEDQALLRRAQSGDERAYEQIILAATPALYEEVRRVSKGDAVQIESILQETFWKAWQSLDRQDAGRPILPYLTGIATRLARQKLRWPGSPDAQGARADGIEETHA